MVVLQLRPGVVRVGFTYHMSEAEAGFIIRAVEWVAAHGIHMLPQYTFDAVSGNWLHINYL